MKAKYEVKEESCLFIILIISVPVVLRIPQEEKKIYENFPPLAEYLGWKWYK